GIQIDFDRRSQPNVASPAPNRPGYCHQLGAHHLQANRTGMLGKGGRFDRWRPEPGRARNGPPELEAGAELPDRPDQQLHSRSGGPWLLCRGVQERDRQLSFPLQWAKGLLVLEPRRGCGESLARARRELQRPRGDPGLERVSLSKAQSLRAKASNRLWSLAVNLVHNVNVDVNVYEYVY